MRDSRFRNACERPNVEDMDHCPPSDQDRLGGRLPLLTPVELSGAQHDLYEHVRRTRVVAAEQAGYVAALADGRLIGPFNALLRLPDVGSAMLGWARTIHESLERVGVTPEARETVILTVVAGRRSPYAVYAHTAAAHRAGLQQAVIDAIVAGREPPPLPTELALAHRLGRCLAAGSAVDDDTYADAIAAFGVPGLVGLVCLAGQYLTTSALLTCFDVPVPATH